MELKCGVLPTSIERIDNFLDELIDMGIRNTREQNICDDRRAGQNFVRQNIERSGSCFT